MLITVIMMILAFFNSYLAGKLVAALDVNRIEGRPFEWKLAGMALMNAIVGIYLIIAVYGQGLQRGSL